MATSVLHAVLGLAIAISIAPGTAQGDDTMPGQIPVKTPVALKPVTCAMPAYPALARRNNQEGTVSLEFDIGVEGTVTGSRVLKSSGYPLLDEAALEGLSKCAFKPATQNGVAVAASSKVEYVWVLDRAKPGAAVN